MSALSMALSRRGRRQRVAALRLVLTVGSLRLAVTCGYGWASRCGSYPGRVMWAVLGTALGGYVVTYAPAGRRSPPRRSRLGPPRRADGPAQGRSQAVHRGCSPRAASRYEGRTRCLRPPAGPACVPGCALAVGGRRTAHLQLPAPTASLGPLAGIPGVR